MTKPDDIRCPCGEDLDKSSQLVYSGARQVWWCSECGRLIVRKVIEGDEHSSSVSVDTYAPRRWFKGDDPE